MSNHRDLEISDVLFSNKEKVLLEGDYTCGFIDDFLPDDVYRSLLETFPQPEEMQQDAGSYYSQTLGKLSSPQNFQAFLDKHPQWQKFMELLQSDAFAQDVQVTLQPAIQASFGNKAVRKKWANIKKYMSNKLAWYWKRLWFYPTFGTMIMTRLNRGYEVETHIDSRRKLVSMILYFRPADWQDDWGGNTVFYKLKDDEKRDKWVERNAGNDYASHITSDQQVEFDEDFEELVSVDYKANRLAFFVMNEMSYHRVKPVLCPEGASRCVAVINIRAGYEAG